MRRNEILIALAEIKGAVSLRELARFAGVSTSAVTRLLPELEQTGVLTRERSASGAMAIEVTRKGRRWLRLFYPSDIESDEDQIQHLREVEAEVFVVHPKEVRAIGVRKAVPSFVVTTKRWAALLDIPLPVVLLEHPHALHRDVLTDIELLVILVKHDPAAARQAYTAVAAKPDKRRYRRRRLLKRLREEHLEAAAVRAGIILDARRRSSTPS